MRKRVILLLVSLFSLLNGFGENCILGTMSTEAMQQQQRPMTAKQWESVHATYAAKTYQPKDSWEFITDFNPNMQWEETTREVFQNMKIQLSGDTLLSLNGKKISVRRAKRSLQTKQEQSPCFSSLYDYFANRGIHFAKNVPVLQIKSSKRNIYSEHLEYIYTGDYLVLYHKGMAAIYKYIRRKDQGTPLATAKLIYTMGDMYMDFKKEGSSERAKKYNIRPYNEVLIMADRHRNQITINNENFFLERLYYVNGFPIFACYNYNEDDEFLIYVYKNGKIDEDNNLQIDAFCSYNDVTEDFAMFSDGTIYVKIKEGKNTEIEVYRINKQGDLYRLK
ncbi:hypothetical protein HMPREF2983_03390 [Prevotella sp. HMSC077E09]|uniref:hypothetical protein n=1 Tax=Prevotella sp. HMSC077E09 TaxID=1739487 RepID=UPI0008A20399|nr:MULTISPECIES: hypothetical protein [unclassified Prevotella]OFO75119.1 hypothetical protein HMPREF3018_08990 [Prevotella sp. HMSC077E08]OFP47994.1 hypothetical protein HMPREF2983_03390 [Prevotella sp. HMSC077E09]